MSLLLHVPLTGNIVNIAHHVARDAFSTAEFLATLAACTEPSDHESAMTTLPSPDRDLVCELAAGLLAHRNGTLLPHVAGSLLTTLTYGVTDQALATALTQLTRNDRVSLASFASTLTFMLKEPAT